MKKIISILICIQIALFPAFAFAANVGGWTLSNPVTKGAKVVYDGAKSVIIDGREYLKKGTATIAPAAKDVSKVLARGGAGYALSVAVEQLLGAVDWVLDPANNQIRYTDPTSTPVGKTFQFGNKHYTSVASACNAAAAASGLTWNSGSDRAVRYYYGLFGASTYTFQGFNDLQHISCLLSNTGSASVSYGNNPAHTENEQKTLPLETVAQRVISNAAGGDSSAQQAIAAAAQDIVNDAANGDQTKARPISQELESNAKTIPKDQAEDDSKAQGQSKPNTQNPEAMDITLEFPVFCSWAPIVCQAAQTTISTASLMTAWFSDLINGQKEIEQQIKGGTTELKGELVNQGSKLDDRIKGGTTELKGELVNTGSAVKDVETAVKDGTKTIQGELVNTGSAVKDVETAVKDGTETIQGELVNTGSAVKDVETAVKDGTETIQGEIANNGEKIDSLADRVSNLLDTINTKIQDLIDWLTGEPDLTQDQTDLPIEQQTIDRDPSSFDTDYIVLGAQCPTFEAYTVEVGPISKTLSMDLSPLCDFAAQVRPAILGMSYLTAAGIVVAAIRET